MTLQDDVLAERLQDLGTRARVTLDGERWTRLAEFLGLLFRWNERMNLTALDVGDRGLRRLVIEPLLAARHVPRGAESMMDIGSGGGSPAIPMKIARPQLDVRMVESRARKAAFLRHAVRQLDLGGIEVENCRHETLVQRREMREAHDVVTVRGVRIEEGAGSLAGFLKPGGLFLAFRTEGQKGFGVDALAPLRVEAKYPLLEATGSELVVARRGPVGRGPLRRAAGDGA